MDKKRIIFFKGAYDTLDLFTSEMADEFIRCGHEIMIYDVKDTAASLGRLAAFAAKPVDFAVSYNNLGFNMELASGRNVWNDLGVTFINILFDHPFHYREALKNAPANAVILCCDRNHVKYIERFYKNIKYYGFMPHGGNNFAIGRPWEERGIDVFYAGGLSRDLVGAIMPVCEKYTDFDGKSMIREVYDELVNNPSELTENVIEKYMVSHGILLSDDELSSIITDFRVVDSFATSYYREKTIDVLVNNGIKVLVCGRGWENSSCFNNPNFIYGGFVSPSQVLELMCNTKIVLNTMTWFKDGSHDRVFNGMLAGAVSVTDSSGYINETIRNGENGIVFELNDTEGLAQTIKELLGSPEKSKKIAAAGNAMAANNHLMKHRAHYIMDNFMN